MILKDKSLILKDINGNNVEISREEIANVIEELRSESPRCLETFNDFVDWVRENM